MGRILAKTGLQAERGFDPLSCASYPFHSGMLLVLDRPPALQRAELIWQVDTLRGDAFEFALADVFKDHRPVPSRCLTY
jgi:hypothetical protein